MKLTLHDSKDGQFYLELQAGGNNETLMVSETYKEKETAEHCRDLILAEAPNVQYADATSGEPHTESLVVTPDDEPVGNVHRMTPEPEAPIPSDPEPDDFALGGDD
jgi:uncharacterized protein YegP (UPF0339 family)